MRFFHKRNLYLKDSLGTDDEKVSELFSYLKIGNKLKSYWNNLFEYCFKYLPIQIGFPKKYLNEQEYEKQFHSNSFTYDIMKFQNEVDENGIKRFDEKGFEIEKKFTYLNEINFSARELVNNILTVISKVKD